MSDIVRALDAEGDWTFGQGTGNYISMNAFVGQNVQTRLLSFLADCFFDSLSGLDWFNLLGSKNKLAIELAVSACILNTPGVTRLLSLDVVVNSNRNLSLSYEIETIYTGLSSPTDTISSSGNFLLTQDGFVLTTQDGDPIVTQGS